MNRDRLVPWLLAGDGFGLACLITHAPDGAWGNFGMIMVAACSFGLAAISRPYRKGR